MNAASKRHRFIAGFAALVLMSTVAHVAFKLTANATMPPTPDPAWLARVLGEPWLYLSLACYAGCFVTWMGLLRSAPIGPAFAASHLELLGVLAASAWLFNERISLMQVLGTLLIVAGVVSLAVGEDRAARRADRDA